MGDRNNQMKEFSLQQQWKSQNLYERLLPVLVEVIEAKIQHWQELINGYPTLNPF